MAHRILHLAKTTRGSRDARRFARDEIINWLRENNPSIGSDGRHVPHST